MRRIKVCHVLYGLNIGGIETLAVKLVNRMNRAHFEHLLLCLTPQNELDGEVEEGAARIIHLDRQDGLDWKIIPQVTRILRRERPDVVHTRNWSTFLEGVVPSLLAGVPGRVHSFDGLNVDNLGEEPRRRILAQRALMPSIQNIVARSEAMRTSMCQQLSLDPARVQLIADGIDLERYDRPVDRLAVRRHWGISPDELVVGIVARLDPVKDHATLFRALARVLPEVPGLKLLVVGGGPLEASMRQEIAQSPLARNVIFTGPQLDVPSLYHIMDLYAQPSLYEGVSGSILEAMAARLPILSTAVGGTVDIVQEGHNGHLVAAGDDAGLAQHLLRLCRNNPARLEMGMKARVYVEDHYSLGQVITQYSQVYQQAAGMSGMV